MDPILAALACVAAQGVRARDLCARLEGPDAALRELEALGSSDERATALEQASRWQRVCERIGVRVIPAWLQPPRLCRGPLAPAVTFWRGSEVACAAPVVAVIGARAAGAEAVTWASELAYRLARHGVSVVSGGARGIDAAAHRGALDGGGATLAVIGVAADRLYPAGNRRLFARMLGARGGVMTEHPPGVRTLAYEHAQRNRLIAALADAVVVVEADAESGTRGAVAAAAHWRAPIWISPDGVGGERAGLETYRNAYGARTLERVEDLFAGPGGPEARSCHRNGGV